MVSDMKRKNRVRYSIENHLERDEKVTLKEVATLIGIMLSVATVIYFLGR
jgi:hypothetical protein